MAAWPQVQGLDPSVELKALIATEFTVTGPPGLKCNQLGTLTVEVDEPLTSTRSPPLCGADRWPSSIGAVASLRCVSLMCPGASPVPVQMWQGRAQSRCRCSRGEPSRSADVAGVSPVPAQMD